MFNKSRSPAAGDRDDYAMPIPPMPDPTPRRPEPAPPSVNRSAATLSSDLRIEGNVSGAGDLQVDGSIKGDIRVGRLIVGDTGVVEGSITGEYVEVRGRVVGAVTGKQVKLVSTAYVDGDITAEQLSIDIGAFFQGRCIQSRRETPPAAAPRPAPSPGPAPTPPPADRAAAPSSPQTAVSSSAKPAV